VTPPDIEDDSPPRTGDRCAIPSANARDHIHRLWDTLAGFEAADGDDALRYLLATVAALVDAQNAYWLGVLRVSTDARDPLLGWRPRIIRYLNPLQVDQRYARQKIRAMGQGDCDESTMAHVRLAGAYRARRLRDLVSPAWFRSETYTSGYLGRGIHDALLVGVPVNAFVEGYYGFHRKAPTRFTVAERAIALYAMRGLTWFHRQIMLSHGLLVARSMLTPAERRVLALLLSDHSEKRIAGQLGLTPATVHVYVTAIFRKFNVSGRAGLTALWLGKAR
jgi:DNA-binding CsgD family transcriptional regulator